MKKIKRILLFIFLVLAVAGGFQIKGGYDKFQNALLQNPLDDVMYELQCKENYAEYGEIPPIYFDAVVAVEDRRFYTHSGFDIIGTTRAIYNDIRAGSLQEGGSTITQQLAKNLYFPQDNSLQRKIAEIFMAVEIEKQYSKEKILELYVNAVYYGSGYYSIYDASMGYFGKPPIDMTDYECTLLAGIPNAPSVYSLDVNPDLAYMRREKVVSCMVECGYIDENHELLN